MFDVEKKKTEIELLEKTKFILKDKKSELENKIKILKSHWSGNNNWSQADFQITPEQIIAARATFQYQGLEKQNVIISELIAKRDNLYLTTKEIEEINKKIEKRFDQIKKMQEKIFNDYYSPTAKSKLQVIEWYSENKEIDKKIIYFEQEKKQKLKNIFFKIITLGCYNRKQNKINEIKKLESLLLKNSDSMFWILKKWWNIETNSKDVQNKLKFSTWLKAKLDLTNDPIFYGIDLQQLVIWSDLQNKDNLSIIEQLNKLDSQIENERSTAVNNLKQSENELQEVESQLSFINEQLLKNSEVIILPETINKNEVKKAKKIFITADEEIKINLAEMANDLDKENKCLKPVIRKNSTTISSLS